VLNSGGVSWRDPAGKVHATAAGGFRHFG